MPMELLTQEILPMLRETAAQTQRAAQKQLALWRGGADKPLLLLQVDCPLADRLPAYDLREIHFDRQKMLLSQLAGALRSRAGNAAAVPSVRSNMGCGIYPTLFGMEQELFADKMPWIQKRLSKERVLSMTTSDLAPGREFAQAIEQMAYMKEMLVGTGVQVYPLDLQGAVDIGHLVLGDAFFYELYDDPGFVHHLLGLAASAMIMGVGRVMEVIAPGDYVAHYNDLVLPVQSPLKLSEDTTTLLSREHIHAFALPHTKDVLKALGGGYMHFCGRNDHLLEAALAQRDIIGLNLGNPEKHDMEAVLHKVARAGKVFYGNCAQAPGESARAYFTRVINAQRGDGRAHLLLPYSCAAQEREDVLSDWIAAGGDV